MSHLKKIGLMMMFFGFHHAWLHAATYTLDPSHTSIGFSVKHLMITDVSGQFKTYEAKVELDEKTNELKGVGGQHPGFLYRHGKCEAGRSFKKSGFF